MHKTVDLSIHDWMPCAVRARSTIRCIKTLTDRTVRKVASSESIERRKALHTARINFVHPHLP